MKANGLVYALLVVIVLMAAVIVVQQNEIQKNNVTVELIGYSGNEVVDVSIYQQKYGDWLGIPLDGAKVEKFNITQYGIILYRDQS